MRDLSLGTQGDDVHALHTYLTRYGYFPNAALAGEYPTWSPIVTDAPAFEDVFDKQTEAGLLALQERSGLLPTGIADEPTRALLQSSRCGVPDGLRSPGAAGSFDKFAHNGLVLSNASPIRWRLLESFSVDGIPLAQVRAAITSAFASWSQQTHLSFTEVTSGTATIRIQFAFLDGIDGLASPQADGSWVITFNSDRTWSVTNPTPAGMLDIQSVGVHEIGHALGLDHSSFLSSVMWPFTAKGLDRVLSKDDNAAISSLYDDWAVKPGRARDIATSATATWVIGNTATAGGFTIHRWNGSSWDTIPGGAKRIAVSASGRAWVVNDANVILRRINRDTAWETVPGCATDIAAGIDQNDVWVIGCNGGVFKRDEVSRSWQSTDGVGTRIAVTSAGIPWVVQANGNIFERSTSSATSGSWIPRAGCARDIGAYHHTWITTCTTTPGGTNVAIWNQQPLANGGSSPFREGWKVVVGGATDISVGPYGPWAINDAFSIFQQNKPGSVGD
jgi:hypothetical protein